MAGAVADQLAARYKRAVQARADAMQRTLERSFVELVDLENIRASAGDWMDVALPTVVRERYGAASDAEQYLSAIRLAETRDDDFRVPTLDELVDAAEAESKIRASLWIMGPKSLEERVRQLQEDADDELGDFEALGSDALELTSREVAGAAVRHQVDGGREVAKGMTMLDELSVGWRRITAPGCCYFCALLATNGFCYTKGSFDDANSQFSGEGSAKVHDDCACVLIPRYGDADSDFSAKAKRDEALYKSLTPGGNQLLKFRRAYEGRAQDGDVTP